MALFLPGPTVAEVRGSIGGTTYSRNRYGAYMRYRAKPTVSQTEKATNAKARMAAQTQAWQNLTVAQQLAWNMWANGNPVVGRLGVPQLLTGHAAFVGINTRLMLTAAAVLTTPPTTPAPAGLVTMSFVADKTLSTCDITYTATPLAADDKLWLQGCYVASAGKHWVENLFRFCGVGPLAQASPADRFAAIEAAIGAMTIGHRLIMKVSVFDTLTGLLSAPLRSEDTIV